MTIAEFEMLYRRTVDTLPALLDNWQQLDSDDRVQYSQEIRRVLSRRRTLGSVCTDARTAALLALDDIDARCRDLAMGLFVHLRLRVEDFLVPDFATVTFRGNGVGGQEPLAA